MSECVCRMMRQKRPWPEPPVARAAQAGISFLGRGHCHHPLCTISVLRDPWGRSCCGGKGLLSSNSTPWRASSLVLHPVVPRWTRGLGTGPPRLLVPVQRGLRKGHPAGLA